MLIWTYCRMSVSRYFMISIFAAKSKSNLWSHLGETSWDLSRALFYAAQAAQVQPIHIDISQFQTNSPCHNVAHLNTVTSPLVASRISRAAVSPLSIHRQRSKTRAPLLNGFNINILISIANFHLLRSSAVYFPMPVFAPVIATTQPSSLVLLWYCRP